MQKNQEAVRAGWCTTLSLHKITSRSTWLHSHTYNIWHVTRVLRINICISSEYFIPWLPSVLFVFDLFYNVLDHLPTKVDLSALSRCNHTSPRSDYSSALSRHIRTSIHKVGRLAIAMESDNTHSQYCIRLRVNSKVTHDTSYDQQYTLDLQNFGDLS